MLVRTAPRRSSIYNSQHPYNPKRRWSRPRPATSPSLYLSTARRLSRAASGVRRNGPLVSAAATITLKGPRAGSAASTVVLYFFPVIPRCCGLLAGSRSARPLAAWSTGQPFPREMCCGGAMRAWRWRHSAVGRVESRRRRAELVCLYASSRSMRKARRGHLNERFVVRDNSSAFLRLQAERKRCK